MHVFFLALGFTPEHYLIFDSAATELCLVSTVCILNSSFWMYVYFRDGSSTSTPAELGPLHLSHGFENAVRPPP